MLQSVSLEQKTNFCGTLSQIGHNQLATYKCIYVFGVGTCYKLHDKTNEQTKKKKNEIGGGGFFFV